MTLDELVETTFRELPANWQIDVSLYGGDGWHVTLYDPEGEKAGNMELTFECGDLANSIKLAISIARREA